MTEPAPSERPPLGTVMSVDGAAVVHQQVLLHADVARVWRALTDRDELARWLGDVVGECRSGGVVHVRFHASGAEADHRLDELEPRERLSTTVVDGSSSSTSSVDVALTADDGATTLTVTQSGLPLRWASAYAAGLQVHVEDLERHLAGEGRCDSDARMGQLVPLYEEQGIVEA